MLLLQLTALPQPVELTGCRLWRDSCDSVASEACRASVGMVNVGRGLRHGGTGAVTVLPATELKSLQGIQVSKISNVCDEG